MKNKTAKSLELSFDHAALTVADLERSVEFYETLGFKVEIRYKGEDGGYDIVHLKLGENYVELFSKPGISQRNVSDAFAGDIDTIGIKHFSLCSNDLEATVRYLRGNGLEPTSEIMQGKTVSKYVFFRDPDGNWVEIAER